MLALSRCVVNGLALLAGSAAGVRVVKHEQKQDLKFIAGVPVLNYQAAYRGKSVGELGVEEEWVVVVNAGVTDSQIENLCTVAKNGCKLAGHPSDGGVPFFEMRGTEQDLAVVIQASHGAIKYVEPDQIIYAIPEISSDNVANGLWGLQRVGAYQRSSDGNGVTVFVLDTGVRTTHNDFAGRGIPTLDMTRGYPMECNGALWCAADNEGHGTHCAGTAAGNQYGVAPAATVRSVKVLPDQGLAPNSWIIGGVDWLARSRIRPAVASMSLGGRGTPQTMHVAVDAASRTGVSVIVAAGNENEDACSFSPAFVPSAIAVGSTDSLDRRSSFSNYGRCTNLWAPGSSILSAGHRSNTDTAINSGTSMACPHVSGGAALVLQRNPSFNYMKVWETLYADGIANAITGLGTGDTNRLLYVGERGPPSPPVVFPRPTPAPPVVFPRPTPAPPVVFPRPTPAPPVVFPRPTPAPPVVSPRMRWYLGSPGKSCTEACSDLGHTCLESALASVDSQATIEAAADQAGRSCQGSESWAYAHMPGICTDPGCCNSGCVGVCTYGNTGHRSCIGVAPWTHSRLCPCSHTR